MRMLGFVRRQYCDFNNIICLKTLYCAFVRSGIEYGSIIWSSYQNILIQRLNNVQYNFLKYLSHKFDLNISIDNLKRELNFNYLTSRRKFNDTSSIYKLLNNKISCPQILKKMN
jgi:hypothetical protein